jgi:transcription initiation factor TFIIE subunit beta
MSTTIYSQPASTSTGQDARTNVLYAISRLKEKSPQAIPGDELVSYVLPAQAVSGDPQRVKLFLTFLNNNEKVNYHRDTDSYSFRPLHNIFTAEDLLAYLQRQETATGISVRDLKDGWADVETTIDKLEKEHKLLVTRNKKDNHPRMVWIDDPTLWLTIDGEYKEIWENIPVPEKPDDVIQALKAAGFKPAGTVSKPVVKKVEKGKKKVRRGHKTTNTHMQGLFKDYSALKPKAAT